jgi:hypothetical protein
VKDFLSPQAAIDKLEQIHRELDVLEQRSKFEGLSSGQEEHKARLNSQFLKLEAEVEEHRTRAERREQIGKRPHSRVHSLPDTSTADTLTDVQDQALRSLDRLSEKFSPDALDIQEQLVRLDEKHAREIEVHSRPAYDSAFEK